MLRLDICYEFDFTVYYFQLLNENKAHVKVYLKGIAGTFAFLLYHCK